jgi:hypothetical protein
MECHDDLDESLPSELVPEEAKHNITRVVYTNLRLVILCIYREETESGKKSRPEENIPEYCSMSLHKVHEPSFTAVLAILD